MKLDISYEKALDFGHCESIDEAMTNLSTLTNLLNKVVIVRQTTKKAILAACSTWKGKNFHKISWDNKLVLLSELARTSELADLWQDADLAYRLIKNKQDQVIEDLYALKKMIDITPR